MYLYLVRHGQSEGNARRLIFGRNDYPLTPLGREQARRAAEKLREVSFTRCCASDLIRAWDTALICVEGRGIRPEKCPALREMDMGELEGLTFEEAVAGYGAAWRAWIEDNWYRNTLPTAERGADMERRVAGCVDAIIRRGEDTLIAAHNGSLMLLMKHLGLRREEDMNNVALFFDFGCYSAIRVEDGRCELVAFNK